jgi:hypothetical protein
MELQEQLELQNPITQRRRREILRFLKPKAGEPSAFEGLFEERERERRREK